MSHPQQLWLWTIYCHAGSVLLARYRSLIDSMSVLVPLIMRSPAFHMLKQRFELLLPSEKTPAFN